MEPPGGRPRPQWPDHGGGPGSQSLVQATEQGNDQVKASYGEDPGHGAVSGDDQPQLAAFGHRPFVRPDQDSKPGRIAEPGAGHVHHDRGVPAGSSVEENCPEVLGGCDVDLFWRRHQGHADLARGTGLGSISAVRPASDCFCSVGGCSADGVVMSSPVVGGASATRPGRINARPRGQEGGSFR